jgi:hypothetical protein
MSITASTILLAEEHEATRSFLAVIWGCVERVVDVVDRRRIGVIRGVICGSSSVSAASAGVVAARVRGSTGTRSRPRGRNDSRLGVSRGALWDHASSGSG